MDEQVFLIGVIVRWIGLFLICWIVLGTLEHVVDRMYPVAPQAPTTQEVREQ